MEEKYIKIMQKRPKKQKKKYFQDLKVKQSANNRSLSLTKLRTQPSHLYKSIDGFKSTLQTFRTKKTKDLYSTMCASTSVGSQHTETIVHKKLSSQLQMFYQNFLKENKRVKDFLNEYTSKLSNNKTSNNIVKIGKKGLLSKINQQRQILLSFAQLKKRR